MGALMASPFQSVGAVAVRLLARQAAIRLVKDELTRQGIRAQAQDIHTRADALLRERPQLLEEAMARVWAWTVEAQQARLHEALFDQDGRSRPVGVSGDGEAAQLSRRPLTPVRHRTIGILRCRWRPYPPFRKEHARVPLIA